MNALVYVDIDWGIHKGKLKNTLNEKRKKLHGFSFSINIANFEAFRRTKKLFSNLFFLKSVGIKVSGLCNISTLDRIGFVGSNQDCGLKSSCFLGCIGGFNFGEQTSIWKSLKFGFSTFGPVFDPYLGRPDTKLELHKKEPTKLELQKNELTKLELHKLEPMQKRTLWFWA